MRILHTFELLFLAIFLFFQGVCSAQQIDENQVKYINRKYLFNIKRAQTLILDLMHKNKIPGLSVCVATDSMILWAEGFGSADLENQIPVRLNSKFRIGSISKTLTVLALGKLIEDNRIHLSDNVSQYVQDFPRKKYPVTIGELAAHTAGIRDYNYAIREYLNEKRYSTVQESLNLFKNDSLVFVPGTKFGYSTYGYVLLSAAIEGASHEDFLHYMRDSVFAVMHLDNTVADYNDSIIPNRVKFYDLSDGKIVNSMYVDNSYKWAGAGFLSTPYDLVKMSQELLNGRFLNKETINRFWTPDTLADGKTIGYGIGWKLGNDILLGRYVFHGGSALGGRSVLLVLPARKLIMAVSCNINTSFDQQFVLEIADLFSYPPPSKQ